MTARVGFYILAPTKSCARILPFAYHFALGVGADRDPELHEHALALERRHLGPRHPNVARDSNNKGLTLKYLDRLSEALNCYEDALVISRFVYGNNHPSVALNLYNIGMIYKELGKRHEVRSHLVRALEMLKRFYPPEHNQVQTILVNLLALG